MQFLKQQLNAHRWRTTLSWMLIDGLIFYSAYTVAFATRSLTSQIIFRERVGYIVLALAITLAALFLNGIYRRLWTQTDAHDSRYVWRAVAMAFVLLLAYVLTQTPRPIPLSVLMIANLLGGFGIIAVRYRGRLVADLRPDGDLSNAERVLIVGAGESGQATAQRIQQRILREDKSFNIVGFIDDDLDKQGMYLVGKPVLGTSYEMVSVAKEHKIDVIVVAVHNISGVDFRRILEACEETDARVQVVPDMVELLTPQANRARWLRDVQPEDLIGRSQVTRHDSVDMQPVSGRVVLVTGAAGSIGSELCRQMLDYGVQRLVILDSNESALHDLHIELETYHSAAEIIPTLVDVTQYSDFERIMQRYRPQVMYHAAAYKHVPMLEKFPNEALRVNVGGTLNAAQLARHYGVERFVLISTDKAVQPSNVMGASKRMCELIIHALGRDSTTLFTAVRFGNVLGSRGSVVPTFTKQIERGGPVTVTHAEMSRYFMSIPEAVNLVIHAAAMTAGDDIFVLRMGEEIRILDIAERMIRLRGLRPYQDIPITFIGIRDGEKLNELLHSAYEQPRDTAHPDIMKLDTWMLADHADVFVTGVHDLLRQGLHDLPDPLQSLLALCQMGEDEVPI